MNRVWWLILFAGLAPVRSARGDLLYFERGGGVQLPARLDGDRVTIDAPSGSLAFLRSDFRAIVPGNCPERQWPERLSKAEKPGVSAEAKFAAAWWAIENGLVNEAEPLLKSLHHDQPTHQPTSRMIALLNRLDEPIGDPDVDPIQQLLPGQSWRIASGPHVVVLHQHEPSDVKERIATLERVIKTYYLVLAAWGIEPAIPRSKLMSVWFARKPDYLSFLKQEVGDAFANTQGYYHPTRELVLTYDSRDDQKYRDRIAGFERQRSELAKLRAAIDRLPANGRLRIALGGEQPRAFGRKAAEVELARLGRDIERQELLADLDARMLELDNASHEQIHQLVVASALVRRHDVFPIWLHEGLAMQFEVIRGGRWAGVGRAHDARLPVWRKLGSSVRLPQLVADKPFGHGYNPDSYAQAWALVYFLRQERPREFVTFLDLLRSSDPSDGEFASPPERNLSLFRKAFGNDLGRIEADWKKTITGLKTPLEAEAPPEAALDTHKKRSQPRPKF